MEQTLFDYSNPSPAPDYQDALRRALVKQRDADLEALRARGIWPPPWQNDDFTIQQDEARLLSAIADNFGLPWSDNNGPICLDTTHSIGMTAIGNARAVIVRCLQLGYIEAKHDKARHCIRLDMTNLGREMLDLWEEDNSREQENG